MSSDKKGIALFGLSILDDLSHTLLQKTDVLNFQKFLPGDTNHNTAKSILREFLQSHCNSRGKDYAGKTNAKDRAKLM